MPLLFLIAYRAIDVLIWLLIATALLSWFPIDPRNRWVRLLHAITEPVLHPIRLLVPPIGGFSLDIIIAVLLLSLIQRVFLQALMS
ncbi:YggT family protein [Geothrix rubra]|uniref:YggT family protein n=1 Tax=Geothrix rubra TaxID=2927977 RepID=A0ABQ5Q3X5_9BACT|nr:YggT family protein [Geothrix rubra]GLH69011.1 YggT family protein [Geothrix rubra]